MANQWVRLWLDMPNDPKWRTISRVSKQPIHLVIAVFVHLLCDAANAGERGVTQCDAEDVASALDVTDESVTLVLEAMQGRVLDGKRLIGWERRQPLREDNSAERTKAWREKKKSERSVTQCDAPDTDTDTDTDTEEKINTLLVGSESRPRPVEEKKPPRKTRKPSSDQPLAPEQFKTAWESYPKRAGDNPKADAVRAWNARIRDGTDPQTMVDGTRRYLSFCLATRKVGTEKVKHAATFFGPNRSFEDPWVIPPPTNTRRAADNSSVAAEVVRRFNAKHGIVATDSDKPFIDGVCYAEK